MLGFNDDRVSAVLKATVMQGDVTVTGLIGEGTSREITSTWSSPFERDSLGDNSKFQKIASFVQLSTGSTSKTKLNTTLVWDGCSHSFNLVLKFLALKDPVDEVMEPIAALEAMAAADIAENIPIRNFDDLSGLAGRIPQVCSLNVARRLIIKDVVLKSVSTPLDKTVDKDGNMLQATINLSFEPLQMINKSEIRQSYGLS